MSKQSLIDKLAIKYAKDEDAPETLRSGLSPLNPIQPRYVSPQIENVPDLKESPPLIDVGNRGMENLRPDKKRMLTILDILYKANVVTPIYYQHASKHLYLTDNVSQMYRDFLQILADAEKEAAIYQARLAQVKKLLGK